MAEILGIATGIAGLLSLTIEVSKFSSEYVKGVRSASDSVRRILQELQLLEQVLFELNRLTYIDDEEIFSSGPSRLRVQRLVQDPTAYQKMLQDLRRELLARVTGKPSSIEWKKLSWPFSEAKNKQILADLQRYLEILQSERFRTILSWLSSSQMGQKQDDVFSKRQGSTGSWVLQTHQFQDWLNRKDGHTLLWCHGNPGSGKTVMMSIIVDHITNTHQNPETGIGYVYCDDSDQQNQTASELLAALAKQIVAKQPKLPRALEDLYESLKRENRRPNLDQINSLLESLCNESRRTFLVIDALDECGSLTERGMLVSTLISLQRSSVRILVSSRGNLEDLRRRFVQVPQIHIKATESDIRTYVHQKLNENQEFKRRIGMSPQVEHQIVDTITESASGMFLLAVLQLNQIQEERTATKILKSLKSLPSGLEQTYEAALKRIQRQVKPDSSLAMRVLQWLSHANRPLLVEELCQALAIEWDEDEGEDRPQDLDWDNIQDPTSLLDVCAGLVTIEDGSNVIRLVHSTAKEYFTKFRDIHFPEAVTGISRTCLAYLLFTEFNQGFCKSDEELDHRLKQYPFLTYAAQQWGRHVRGDSEQTLEDLASVLLKDDYSLSSSNQVMYISKFHRAGYSQKFPRSLGGLHVTASFGLEKLSLVLLEQGLDCQAKDSWGRVPMHYAAAAGFGPVVRLLLAHKADVGTTDSNGSTPLHHAAENGHTEVAKLLLTQNVMVDAKDKQGDTALHEASKWGHTAMVRLLLEHKANVQEPNEQDWTPLHVAAETGHRDTAQILLRGGADLSIRDKNGWTALHRAAARGQAAILELLLESGSEIDELTEDHEKSALVWAAEVGQPDMTRLLLSRGADVALQDIFGETALHYASENGHEATVLVLLKCNAPIDILDKHRRTPLDCAEQQGVVRAILKEEIRRNTPAGSEQTEQYLAVLTGDYTNLKSTLDNHQPVNPVTDFKDTALHLSALEGLRDMASLLIDRGFDVNCRGSSRGTPLHRAATNGHASVVRLLLGRGADVNAQTRTGGTALGYATVNGHIPVVKILLQTQRVDVNAYNGVSTALYQAASYGHSAVVQLLIEQGAKVEQQHLTHRRTALLSAAKAGHLETVRVLLDAHADVNFQDFYSCTALHCATYGEHREVVQLLMHRGANKNLKDRINLTPFEVANRKGYRSIMMLLS